MEEQLFSPNANAQLFDLPLSTNGPIGFSPSIDMTSSLPLTFGDGLEIPAFMQEVQRKRADTITTLKPDFEFHEEFNFESMTDLSGTPQRPRAVQRLSLTPSVASSAASTASEFDYNSGFDSEADHSSAPSPATDDVHAADWTETSFRSFDSTSDSIQTAFDRIRFQSPDGSRFGTLKQEMFTSCGDFSFHDFIEDAAQPTEMPAGVESMPAGDNVTVNMTSQAPISPLGFGSGVEQFGTHGGHMRCSTSDSSLGLFGAVGHGNGMPMHSYPSQPLFGNPGAYPMVLSQSVPDASCFHPNGSPCPSSPSSARSSSPYPTFGMAGGIPSVLASPPSRHDLSQIQLQHMPSQTHGMGILPKGMSLYSHFAHLANPYAGLITKRSRGRRVPNKPEEMNNLGKSGKVYTCKVPGCGKCFKRSEHLKRHVRSIHTDDKPFLCPFPACNKRFSRHDNLNQHARVHTSMGGVGGIGDGEEYDASSVHPLSHLNGMPLAHPMILTAGPEQNNSNNGLSAASEMTQQIKQE